MVPAKESSELQSSKNPDREHGKDHIVELQKRKKGEGKDSTTEKREKLPVTPRFNERKSAGSSEEGRGKEKAPTTKTQVNKGKDRHDPTLHAKREG